MADDSLRAAVTEILDDCPLWLTDAVAPPRTENTANATTTIRIGPPPHEPGPSGLLFPDADGA